MEQYEKQFENCRQWEKPFCTAACPFHVDILDFQEKMARKSFNAAYKTFRNAVGFPDIVAALCPEYCAACCPRQETDQAVQLNLLEKTCVAKTTKKDSTDYNVPVKNRKIGIIGAGASGLACALRLSAKKYDVTVYEKTGRLGGQLWDLLPSDVFMDDIQRQFQFETYTLHLDAEVKNIEELEDQGFEAIYIATGKDGADFGALDHENDHCFLKGNTAVFAGGSLTGKDPVLALADGLDMAWAIEIYLKTARLEYPKAAHSTKAVADPDKLRKTEAVLPTDNGIFTKEEAAAEAARCIRCQCDACRRDCDLTDFYNKWPLKLKDKVIATISPSDSMIHGTPGIRLINTCTQCGLCEDICPAGIDMAGMLLEAKKRLHNLDKMPGAYHQFWLNDMNFANSEFAAIRKKAPGQNQCAYAFFPGCQLGAADPRYVILSYQWLLSKKSDTGLLLRCCGVPAAWAGNEEMHRQEIADIRRDWEVLGKPVLIMACPSCARQFSEQMPEIQTISLYEIMDQWGFAVSEETKAQPQTYAVFDPCSTRNIQPIQQAVRKLAVQAGASLEELPKADRHGCCGYGGHVSVANPDFADYVAKKQTQLSDSPYITYCVNCRDIFLGKKKPTSHILDMLFDINRNGGDLPYVTERRQNRTRLKETLLKDIWGETMETKPGENKFKLIISPKIQSKMNDQKLLEEDICSVLELADSTGGRIYNAVKDTYTASRELGHITCWVEYRPIGDAFEIVNVYSHRIKIELEMIWNGRKTDFDLR